MKKFLITLLFILFSSNTFADVSLGIDFGVALTSDSRVDEITKKRSEQGSPYVTSSYDDGAIFLRGFAVQKLDSTYIELGLFTANGFSADYTDGGVTGTDDHNVNGVDAIFGINILSNTDLNIGAHYSFIDGDDSLTIGNGSHDIKSINTDGAGPLIGLTYNFNNFRTRISYYGGLGGNSNSYMTILSAGVNF